MHAEVILVHPGQDFSGKFEGTAHAYSCVYVCVCVSFGAGVGYKIRCLKRQRRTRMSLESQERFGDGTRLHSCSQKAHQPGLGCSPPTYFFTISLFLCHFSMKSQELISSSHGQSKGICEGEEDLILARWIQWLNSSNEFLGKSRALLNIIKILLT